MGFNSAFKGLKLLKNPGNGRLNNLNDPVLNVLRHYFDGIFFIDECERKYEKLLRSQERSVLRFVLYVLCLRIFRKSVEKI